MFITYRSFPDLSSTGRVKKGFLLLLLALSLLSCVKKSAENANLPSVAPGNKAPDFTAKDLSGREVSLSALKGRVVVLEFWATWCPPCRATIPDLNALQEKYRDRSVTVLAVSVDEGQDLTTSLAAFSKENKMNYTVLIGNDALTRAYKVRNIPVVFLIDRNGVIVGHHVGAVGDFAATVAGEIDKIL